MTDQIQTRSLLLRTPISTNEEGRRNRQDVLISITPFADTHAAGASNEIAYAVDYRTITKQVIAMVESSRFSLVERMAAEIASVCLDDVRVVKPGALREIANDMPREGLLRRTDLSLWEAEAP